MKSPLDRLGAAQSKVFSFASKCKEVQARCTDSMILVDGVRYAGIVVHHVGDHPMHFKLEFRAVAWPTPQAANFALNANESGLSNHWPKYKAG